MNLNQLTQALKKVIPVSEPEKVNLPKPNSREEKLFWAKNSRTLADFMERYDIKHAQATWGDQTPSNPCGTRACALGTAAIYGLIPGLQYTYPDYRFSALIQKDRQNEALRTPVFVVPTVNGKRTGWETAGCEFFGNDAVHRVFGKPCLSTQQCIDGLRKYADELDPR